ncbi:MAG: response regulator [Oscillochloridaceae bacterium umkhey_bin13]
MCTILVVDDHTHYLASVCRLLESYLPTARLVTATDGSTALRLVQEQQLDLIILDYQLTTITGTHLVRQMRARAAMAGRVLPPIIMTSSQPDVALFVRMIKVQGYIPKPMLEEHITTVIQPLLACVEDAVPTRRQLLWSIR